MVLFVMTAANPRMFSTVYHDPISAWACNVGHGDVGHGDVGHGDVGHGGLDTSLGKIVSARTRIGKSTGAALELTFHWGL